MSFCYFIKGLSADKYGKLTVYFVVVVVVYGSTERHLIALINRLKAMAKEERRPF